MVSRSSDELIDNVFISMDVIYVIVEFGLVRVGLGLVCTHGTNICVSSRLQKTHMTELFQFSIITSIKKIMRLFRGPGNVMCWMLAQASYEAL